MASQLCSAADANTLTSQECQYLSLLAALLCDAQLVVPIARYCEWITTFAFTEHAGDGTAGPSPISRYPQIRKEVSVDAKASHQHKQ